MKMNLKSTIYSATPNEAMNKANNMGDRLQPCFTPCVKYTGSESP